MNWLLILFFIVVAGCVILGYYRGFLRVVYSLAEWVLILLFVTWATPYVSRFLAEQTPLQATLESSSKEELRQSITNMKEDEGTDGGVLDALGLQLPDIIEERLLGTSGLADQFLEAAGVYDLMAHKISQFAVRGIAFLITLLLAFVIFHGVGTALKLVDKIPIVSGVNRTAGGFAGLLQALLFVWVAFAAAAACAGTEWGRWLISFIYEAPILTWLYENNPVLNIFLSFC